MNADSWDEIGLHTGQADRPLFESAVRRCYEHAGVPWHGNVVWTSSPLVVALGAPMAALLIALRRCGHAEQHDVELLSIAEFLLPPSVRSALWKAAQEAVDYARRERPSVLPVPMDLVAETAVDGALATRLRSGAGVMGEAMSTGATLKVMRLAVHASVRAALELAPDRTPVQLALRDVITRAWYQYISGQRRFAFGLMFDDLCGEGELRGLESAYLQAIGAACCWYPHREFVLVCDGPMEIHLERIEDPGEDDEGTHQLHRTDGAALAWTDGWGVHAVHGRYQAVRAPPLVFPRPALTSQD
jgi:hypothetical protein